jgi:hypothetical protein
MAFYHDGDSLYRFMLAKFQDKYPEHPIKPETFEVYTSFDRGGSCCNGDSAYAEINAYAEFAEPWMNISTTGHRFNMERASICLDFLDEGDDVLNQLLEFSGATEQEVED